MSSRQPSSGRNYNQPWWLWPLEKTSMVVPTLTTCCALYTRSAAVAYFIAGATSCTITVKIVKRFIAQPRPELTADGRTKKTYGMPSTHSATITFYMAYITLSSLYLPLHSSLEPIGQTIRVLFPLIAIPWGIAVCTSRIWLGHHTWAQVGAGVTYGLMFAQIWFALWTHGWNEYGAVLEQTFNNLSRQILGI